VVPVDTVAVSVTTLPAATEVAACPPEEIARVVTVGDAAEACAAQAQKRVTKAIEKTKKQEILALETMAVQVPK
jgi:hypothetical protein